MQYIVVVSVGVTSNTKCFSSKDFTLWMYELIIYIIFLNISPQNRHGLCSTHICGTNIWSLHLLLPCGSLYDVWHRSPCFHR